MFLGSTKAACAILHGFDTFCYERLVNDLLNSSFSLLADESLTEQELSQILDIGVNQVNDISSRNFLLSVINFLGQKIYIKGSLIYSLEIACNIPR